MAATDTRDRSENGTMAPAAFDEEALIEEINALHKGVEAAIDRATKSNTDSVMKAIVAGEKLATVKGHVGHNHWGNWVEENFDGSMRTAQLYMRLAARKE